MTSKVKYLGELRTQCTHVASEKSIITDAPIDNNGKGEKFSPTDLFCSSLGSCMLTIMGITAQIHGFNIDGSSIDLNKKIKLNPRRVSAIDILINIKGKFRNKEKQMLINAAKHCPVSKSIHPDIKENISFIFLDC